MFVAGECRPTDDSIMTLAVAKSILACGGDYTKLSESAVHYMQLFGKKYPRAGYGGSFKRWIMESAPQPYNSWGNGSAMRVSPSTTKGFSKFDDNILGKQGTAVPTRAF